MHVPKAKDEETKWAMIVNLITYDEDFVYSRRYEHSATALLKRYPDGVPDAMLAEVLLMDPEAVQEIYENIIVRLRQIMKVEVK